MSYVEPLPGVNRKRMVECGRRASTVPSRNGAKSNEYRLTERGRDLVAGLDADNPEGTAASEPAAPSTGRGLSMGIPRGAGSSLSVQPGESGAGPVGDERPEDAAGLAPTALPVPPAPITDRTASPDSRKAPSMFDPYEGQAA